MITNIIEFNKKVVAALQGRGIPVSIPEGYQIEQMPYYLNIESNEDEYLTFEELINTIELIVTNYPQLNQLDKIMNILEDEFALFQNVTNDESLVSAVVNHDHIYGNEIFGDISNMMWSAFINDELVVNHLKNTKLVLFDYSKGIAVRVDV